MLCACCLCLLYLCMRVSHNSERRGQRNSSDEKGEETVSNEERHEDLTIAGCHSRSVILEKPVEFMAAMDTLLAPASRATAPTLLLGAEHLNISALPVCCSVFQAPCSLLAARPAPRALQRSRPPRLSGMLRLFSDLSLKADLNFYYTFYSVRTNSDPRLPFSALPSHRRVPASLLGRWPFFRQQ